MNLSYADGMVILNYSAGSVSGEKTVFPLSGQTEGLITAVIGFEVQQDTLRLSLGLNTPSEFLTDEGIPLSGPLTGEGTSGSEPPLEGPVPAGRKFPPFRRLL
jgi:hypothetical protein